MIGQKFIRSLCYLWRQFIPKNLWKIVNVFWSQSRNWLHSVRIFIFISTVS